MTYSYFLCVNKQCVFKDSSITSDVTSAVVLLVIIVSFCFPIILSLTGYYVHIIGMSVHECLGKFKNQLFYEVFQMQKQSTCRGPYERISLSCLLFPCLNLPASIYFY